MQQHLALLIHFPTFFINNIGQNENSFGSFPFSNPSLKCYYTVISSIKLDWVKSIWPTRFIIFLSIFPRLRRFVASLYLLNGERIKPYIYPTCSLNTSIWRTSNLLAGFTHSLTSCHSYLLKIFAHTLRQWQIRAVGTAKKR